MAQATDSLQITTSLSAEQMYSVGDTLQVSLMATGGTPPYRWSLDATTAPDGVSIINASDGGMSGPSLTGGLTQAGFWGVVVTATDAAGQIASKALAVGVSRMRLVSDSASGRVGEFIRVVPQIEGGTPPYRIALSPYSLLPLGIRFDLEQNAFFGTPAVTNFGVSLEIQDSAGNLLRRGFGFNFSSARSPMWTYGVRLSEGSCGSLTAKTQVLPVPPYQGLTITMDWGDGESESVPPIIAALHHRYVKDGTYNVSFLILDQPAGEKYTGGYQLGVRGTGDALCQLDLRLHPHALYLVRGTTTGRLRLDARTQLGEYYSVDADRFTWSSTKPALISVDGQGNVSCTGIGEGEVEAVSKDISLRVGANVFCGEYTIEPALSQLSPLDGNNQVQLGVLGVTSSGLRTAVKSSSAIFFVEPQEKADLISISQAGLAAIRRAPRAKSEKVKATAQVDGWNTRNSAIIRTTATNLGMPAKPWRGDNVTIWFPDQVLNFNYKDILERRDALRIADLIYRLEAEESGIRPQGGGMQHLV